MRAYVKVSDKAAGYVGHVYNMSGCHISVGLLCEYVQSILKTCVGSEQDGTKIEAPQGGAEIEWMCRQHPPHTDRHTYTHTHTHTHRQTDTHTHTDTHT